MYTKSYIISFIFYLIASLIFITECTENGNELTIKEQVKVQSFEVPASFAANFTTDQMNKLYEQLDSEATVFS